MCYCTYQAVRSKLISADSLSKTGIFADEAGDFRWILARVGDFQRLETGQKAMKNPINAGLSSIQWTLSLVERVVGCPGRDRTQTLPIEIRPLKYQENFTSKARFSCPETFRPSHNRSGSLETIREKRIGAGFRALDGTPCSQLRLNRYRRAVQTLINCNNAER